MMGISRTLKIIATMLLLSIVAFVIWIQGGRQDTTNSIPQTLDGPEFKIYEAVVPESPLKLLHFISQANEVNVSSSLIMGEKEVIVVSTQATKYASERLADEIEKTGRTLTFVYLDHAHPDHSQGAMVLKKRFPNAKFIAAPRVAALQQLRMQADDERSKKRFGENAAVPSILFEPFDNDKLMIEGHEIQLWNDQYGDVGLGYENEPHTVVYVPDIKALLPNDICYFGGHMMMGGSTKASRTKWKDQIRSYMDMDLQVVVPGHVPRNVSQNMTAKGVLDFSLHYIEDYEEALESSKTSDEVIAKMLKRYPDIGHTSALYIGTFINFKEVHRLTFNPRLDKVVALLPDSIVKSISEKLFDSTKKSANPDPH